MTTDCATTSLRLDLGLLRVTADRTSLADWLTLAGCLAGSWLPCWLVLTACRASRFLSTMELWVYLNREPRLLRVTADRGLRLLLVTADRGPALIS